MRAIINGTELAFSDQGRGTPVVFLHACPLSREMWTPQVRALARECRIITIDLRGHGESGTVRGPLSLDDFADDAAALLDHLSLPQAVFVGLSMGGYTLFALYRRHAARIKGLILADTKAQADTPEGREGRFAMIRTAEEKGAKAIADLMLPKLLSPHSLRHRPDLTQSLTRIIEQNPVTTITADLRAMAERPDSVPLLRTIACPTLVIVGELDQGTPPADAEVMAEGIRGARLTIIPNAGHLSNLEAPDLFNAAVSEFLKDIGSVNR